MIRRASIIFAAGFLTAQPLSAQNLRLNVCMKEAARHFEKGDYPSAEDSFRQCLKMEPKSPAAHVSLAGTLLLQNKLYEAEKEFRLCEKLYPAGSAVLGYCFSRLGDIKNKTDKKDEAAQFYKKAVELDPQELNAHVGLGKYYEDKKQWGFAERYYRAGLSRDQSNETAVWGLRHAQTYLMMPSEILSELKERRAAVLEKTELTDEDKQLFFQMRDAEQMRGVSYLKSNVGKISPRQLLEKRDEFGNYRYLFTLEGFNFYKRYITNAAVKYFQKQKIPVGVIFKLRTLNGNPVFDRSGLLSSDGMEVFYFTLINEKKYLLPGETATASAEASTPDFDDEARAQEIIKKGYTEITELEYTWLAGYTLCSLDTFKDKLAMQVLSQKHGPDRYFVDATGAREDNGALSSMITKHRQGNEGGKVSGGKQKVTSLLGLGGAKAQKLCKSDGTINPLIK
ncbi:MAG: tetratricopeptide repeat protein [Elusimicrobia bacterium]|nr:tetratricopeptide repeat protein [Elusimicrobiota bacterium]